MTPTVRNSKLSGEAEAFAAQLEKTRDDKLKGDINSVAVKLAALAALMLIAGETVRYFLSKNPMDSHYRVRLLSKRHFSSTIPPFGLHHRQLSPVISLSHLP